MSFAFGKQRLVNAQQDGTVGVLLGPKYRGRANGRWIVFMFASQNVRSSKTLHRGNSVIQHILGKRRQKITPVHIKAEIVGEASKASTVNTCYPKGTLGAVAIRLFHIHIGETIPKGIGNVLCVLGEVGMPGYGREKGVDHWGKGWLVPRRRELLAAAQRRW